MAVAPHDVGYHGARRWTHRLLTVGDGGRVGRCVDYFIVALICVNVLAVSLETVDWLYERYATEFLVIETVSVVAFSIEYAGRLWAITEHPEYRRPIRDRFRHAQSPYMLVDLLAILPFFVGVFVDLRFLRAMRLIRFLRLLKLARYSESLRLFFRAFRIKRNQLFITLNIGVVLLFIASNLMYFAERNAQPEVFSSIPAALWWGVVTLTTVGYGDVHPVTPFGKLVGAMIAVLGIGLFALPASILASGFIEAVRENTVRCPYCEEEILEEDLDEVFD